MASTLDCFKSNKFCFDISTWTQSNIFATLSKQSQKSTIWTLKKTLNEAIVKGVIISPHYTIHAPSIENTNNYGDLIDKI